MMLKAVTFLSSYLNKQLAKGFVNTQGLKSEGKKMCKKNKFQPFFLNKKLAILHVNGLGLII